MTPLLVAEEVALPLRLQPTSLRAEAGRLVCLIGPNGSGKTSLLHALARIGSPSGRVHVQGQDPDLLAPNHRQKLVGFLPASRALQWPLKARDVVALGLPPHADVRAAIELLELGPLLDRTVDRLSTGERSRVLIARALAAEPALLLLDEPTANLDPLWQLKLLELLRSITHTARRTMIVALHDLDLAGRYADRLIVMHAGEIAADGDPEALLSGPIMADVFGIRAGEQGWLPA